jgi:uncharacterized repeat protein (TIGR01451 family)/MYXO-CTERM domain-containing protein
MRLRVFARLLAAAGAMIVAGPVLAQTADLGVAVTIADEADVATKGFPIGGTKTFQIVVTNPDPTLVTSFTLNATLDTNLKVSAVTGCDAPAGATTAFPCTVTLPAPGFQSGATVEVDVDIEFPVSKAPATCPVNTTLYAASFTASGAKSGTATVTDGNAANDTASASTYLRPFADLEAVALDGPTDVSEGQTVQYTAHVTNHGPCDATHVRATVEPPATLVFAGEVGAACTNGAAGFEPRNRCELGTVANGASTSFTASYTVQTFPKSVTHAALPIDFFLASRSTGATVAAVDDPNPDNDAAATQATVKLNNGGCSTGGAGTLFGLLSLVALRLRRRKA